LSREGCDAALARNGEEGLGAARRLKPDLITLDVMMPGMDGWAVLQRIKDSPELRHIPVIMATMIEDKKLGYVLGVSDYLVKPIDRELLSQTLRRLDCAPPCRVLVIDDDEGSRERIKSLLEREGWIVSEGLDGVDGLQKLENEKPDLVLLDLMMPRMNGFTFTIEVRKRPEFASIPIVVLTAKDLTAEDREQLNGSVARVISKTGYNRDQLLAELRQLVRLRTGVAGVAPTS
jgi:CheY-like chemotaxis protein